MGFYETLLALDKKYQHYSLAKIYQLTSEENEARLYLAARYLNFYPAYPKNKNEARAISLLELAAEDNNPIASFMLAEVYIEKHSPESITKGKHYLKIAINQKYLLAELYELICFSDANDRNVDFKNTPSLDVGLFESYFLGKYYLSKRNPEAIKIFLNLLAIRIDFTEDIYLTLGFCYENNVCVKFDIRKAVHYYSLAAEFDNEAAIQALYELATKYPDDTEIIFKASMSRPLDEKGTSSNESSQLVQLLSVRAEKDPKYFDKLSFNTCLESLHAKLSLDQFIKVRDRREEEANKLRNTLPNDILPSCLTDIVCEYLLPKGDMNRFFKKNPQHQPNSKESFAKVNGPAWLK